MQQQMTTQQKQQMSMRINHELTRMTMSWDNDLRELWPTLIEGLQFASVKTLGIHPAEFGKLQETDVHGVNMLTVNLISNNLLRLTPHQMNRSIEEWDRILKLNANVAARWNALYAPIEKKVLKEVEIMSNKPPMQIIKAEA